MIDIATIPEEELRKELKESYDDITVCNDALAHGIFEYSGGFVQVRLMINERIAKKIEAELARRGKSAVEVQ